MNSTEGASPLVRNLLLRLAYDGTGFAGWQIQPNQPTIQGTLTEAFAKVLGQEVHLHGAGRTDAGVHACAQAVSVRIQSPIPCPNLQRALNQHLPESIRVLSVEQVPAEFHARHNTLCKTYQYRIYRGAICPPSLARYVYPYPYPLEVQLMQEAALQLEGKHDFRSFASMDDAMRNKERSTVRTIFSSRLEKTGDELTYTVRGDGFLNHMVRNIVGTLLYIGRGTFSADAIPAILEARDRSAAGPTAPARGLHLLKVEYPPLDG